MDTPTGSTSEDGNMARAVVDEETFIGLVEKLGYAAAAREIGVNERGVYSRVAHIEKR